MMVVFACREGGGGRDAATGRVAAGGYPPTNIINNINVLIFYALLLLRIVLV